MTRFSRYRQVLRSLRERGYVFMPFSEFIEKRDELPRKTVVIRYDVHHRDIRNTHPMLEIERQELGRVASSVFVMWRLKGDEAYELNWEREHERDYVELIVQLLSNGVDVQPHVSPINEYLHRYDPSWRSIGEKQLGKRFLKNYRQRMLDEGCEIEVVGDDFLSLSQFNEGIATLLGEYNEAWKQAFGSTVEGYSSHGNHIALNRILNNGIVLNQTSLLEKGLYRYETYGSLVRNRLDFYSDCSTPVWMFEPERIRSNRLQLLCHPDLWDDERLDKAWLEENRTGIERGYLSYPYLAPIDVVTNLSDFLESGEEINEYNERRKSCRF